MTFKNPLILAAIPVIVALFVWLRGRRAEPSFIFPTDDAIRSLRWSLRAWAAGKTSYLRLAVLILVLIALARPQEVGESTKRKNGIAMILSIDCSSTMLAEDLQLGPFGLVEFVDDPQARKDKRLNRLELVKKVAQGFVKAGSSNMIGVVAFGAYAYTICPPTFDQEWILASINRLRVGAIKDGTSIGSGILAGVNSLSSVKAKSRVIVLLTDGNNNCGKVPPLVAAKTAKSLGVKIYTIGIVGKGPALYPVKDKEGRSSYDYFKIEIDEDVLRRIAAVTGGEYYRVQSLDDLKASYSDIDKLEKSRLEQREREDAMDIFPVFLAWAILILLSDIILSNSYLRRIP